MQPGFVVVRVERLNIWEGGRICGVPDLIAEVVSPSIPGHDRVTKRSAYARVFTRGMDLVSLTLPIRVPVDALFRDMLGSRGETQG
ncbi:MAG: hypothetical protein DCC58_19300 [Chloroflexi bacterium]|nr:MAG: hypothetical protein DCC58_19300 [Chloroflexota bacterium]